MPPHVSVPAGLCGRLLSVMLKPEHVIEAALLASRTPLEPRTLRRLFNDELSAKTVKMHLESLSRFWRERGLVLEELPGGAWRFRTSETLAPYLARLSPEKPPRYSRAALETLAVIAYRQPVTRGDIEAIRGVAVNPAIIRQFEERGWIETVGYRETPGRPALLGTTKAFLTDHGLKRLEDLPSIETTAEAAFPLGLENPAQTAPVGELQSQEELHFEKDNEDGRS